MQYELQVVQMAIVSPLDSSRLHHAKKDLSTLSHVNETCLCIVIANSFK